MVVPVLFWLYGILTGENHPDEAFKIGLMISIIAFLYGSIPALTYGALAYALLLQFKKASYLSAFVVGIAPSFLLSIFLPNDFELTLSVAEVPRSMFTGFYAAYGALIGLTTYAVSQRLASKPA